MKNEPSKTTDAPLIDCDRCGESFPAALAVALCESRCQATGYVSPGAVICPSCVAGPLVVDVSPFDLSATCPF